MISFVIAVSWGLVLDPLLNEVLFLLWWSFLPKPLCKLQNDNTIGMPACHHTASFSGLIPKDPLPLSLCTLATHPWTLSSPYPWTLSYTTHLCLCKQPFLDHLSLADVKQPVLNDFYIQGEFKGAWTYRWWRTAKNHLAACDFDVLGCSTFSYELHTGLVCYRYSSLPVQWVSCHIFSLDPVGFYLSRCQIHVANNEHV